MSKDTFKAYGATFGTANVIGYVPTDRVTGYRPGDEHPSYQICRFSKVLEASREYCRHPTPANRLALMLALEEYDRGD